MPRNTMAERLKGTFRPSLLVILKCLSDLLFSLNTEKWDNIYLLCREAFCTVFWNPIFTSLLISNTHTSILFSFFLLIYCVGPNVIETSVARTDLNNTLKVRVNKYCWITWMALFDVSNIKHTPPSPPLILSILIFPGKLLGHMVLSHFKLNVQYCSTTVLFHEWPSSNF